jgi:hypothetical protein
VSLLIQKSAATNYVAVDSEIDSENYATVDSEIDSQKLCRYRFRNWQQNYVTVDS